MVISIRAQQIRDAAFKEAERREKQFTDALTMSRTRVVEGGGKAVIEPSLSGACWFCGSRDELCGCKAGKRT